MRLVCTTPNTVSPINGHEFEPHETGGLVSVSDIPDDEAAVLLTVPGWFELGSEPGGAPLAPGADDIEALRAKASELGVKWAPTWKVARLKAEIEAAAKSST